MAHRLLSQVKKSLTIGEEVRTMKKGLIASLIVALVAVGVTAAFAFGPGYGMGMGSGNGTCAMAGGTVSPEQSQKFGKVPK